MTAGAHREPDNEAALTGEDALGYRRPLPGFSTNDTQPSADGPPRQYLLRGGTLSRDMDRPLAPPRRRLPDLGMALKLILGFWTVYVTLITLRSVALMVPDFWDSLARRLVASLVGAAITFLIYLAMRRLAHATLRLKALVAGILCLPASLLFASFNYYIFWILNPLTDDKIDPMWHGMGEVEMAIRSVSEQALSWYFLFAAWSALYVALSFSAQLRAADRRAAVLEREAQDAQLRALRYQINPHFLFNTLNSLSSLVLSERNDTAERMIMNLSSFFRTTLSADPTADIALEEEIRLQRLYLDIEQIRFPERLKVEVDVPASLAAARVPVLLLQPVVENAVKYGVARSRRPVTIRIVATEEAGKLHIKVKDDGEVRADEAEDDEPASTGVGMRNVCDRLVARFGIDAGCFHGPDPEGGYTVHIILPIVRGNS